MSYLLFFIYLLLCCWLLTKIKFVKNAGLSSKIIIGIFLFKVVAGILNGIVMSRSVYLADTWSYHIEGLKEYHLLFSTPKEYFLDFFRSTYSNGYNGFFLPHQSYWNDLRDNIMIKLLSIFDIFSFGHYYVNIIFYNFVVFFGNIALFRVFADIYKDKKAMLVVTCFLLPSVLYFSSSIHKEGVILALIGVITFNIYYSLHYTGFLWRRILYILLSLFFIFLLRNYIFITLIPAIAAWVIAHYKKNNALLIFLVTYLVGAIVFFNLDKISPRFNLPGKVAGRQADFLKLDKAATDIYINPLQPRVKSFIKNTPQAISHSLLRPHWSDISLSKSLLPFAAEIFFYQVIFLLFIFFYIKNKEYTKLNDPFILFSIFFSISVFLLIGYTVPVLGAIIRYRSIYLLFILTPLFCNIPHQFLTSRLQIKK